MTAPSTGTRVTWGKAVRAALVATVFAAILMLGGVLVLVLVGVPVPLQEGTSGRGWPWRIEGPWSLAADVGPLLAAGAAFAYFAESITTGRAGMPTRRVPIALAAALLGWVNVYGSDDAGVLGTGGFVSFAGLVILTREMSRQPRTPWRWTPRRAWAAVAIASVLVAATVSYGLLHPLNPDRAELTSTKGGVARIWTSLINEGRAKVTVIGVTVPGVEVRALTSPSLSYEYSPDDPDAGMVPIRGRTIPREYSQDLQLVIPIAECPATRIVDRVHMRLQVLGRTVEQVVRLTPVPVGCR